MHLPPSKLVDLFAEDGVLPCCFRPFALCSMD
jgi:hypothetical protein